MALLLGILLLVIVLILLLLTFCLMMVAMGLVLGGVLPLLLVASFIWLAYQSEFYAAQFLPL